jgi:glycine/D-amino acid oxidase-like deaminating enzyme
MSAARVVIGWGYSGHGVLPTLAAARAVSDAILGEADELALYQV